MPGATAQLLLRDLRRCAQFAGATMRTFAPGTFSLPPEAAAIRPPAAPEAASGAGVARSGRRRPRRRAAVDAGGPRDARVRGGGHRPAAADANDLFATGGKARRDNRELAKVSGAKPAGW